MRILVVRIAAYGDVLITTPLIRSLKKQGHEVYYLGSEQAREILANNPNVDKFIFHPRDSVPNEKLGEYFKKISDENECDNLVDLCESVEVRLALSPNYPQWNWTKKERFVHCNRNYYEYSFEHAGMDIPYNDLIPDMHFVKEEQDFIADIRKNLLGQRIVMWGLSGSGRQKTYPHVPYIVGDIVRDFKNVTIMLVGGETCKVLECAFPKHPRILKKSGEFSFRQSALMTKYSDLVVSPDTGFLHAAGCWDVPKIGLLTHTTIENITKHFKNDHSIESGAYCAPCFRLIDDAETQCPTDKTFRTCECMSERGISPELVYNRIKEVLCN